MESRTEGTMWKSIKNCTRNWCQKWPCILYGVIYWENKQWGVRYYGMEVPGHCQEHQRIPRMCFQKKQHFLANPWLNYNRMDLSYWPDPSWFRGRVPLRAARRVGTEWTPPSGAQGRLLRPGGNPIAPGQSRWKFLRSLLQTCRLSGLPRYYSLFYQSRWSGFTSSP